MTDNNGHNSPRRVERRTADRFPIEREVRYKQMEGRSVTSTGAGKTVDMSSCGILFTMDVPVHVGKRVEISVNWPAQLNNSCPIKLVALGRVVRCEGGKAALVIEKYEFRTQGTRKFQDPVAATAAAGGK
jgi:hypothetical protein